MSRANQLFDRVLAECAERHRDEIMAAYAALEHGAEPVPEVMLLALRDATLRRTLQTLLHRLGRTLVAVPGGCWTTGYRDDVASAMLADGWQPLEVIDRAVLTLVLIHSVAIPRSNGELFADTWISHHPTGLDELLRHSQLPRQATKAALGRLRAAGLVALDRSRGAGYVPGPQFNRLTPAARQRLQEDLILAAGPETPLAAAIRARRSQRERTS